MFDQECYNVSFSNAVSSTFARKTSFLLLLSLLPLSLVLFCPLNYEFLKNPCCFDSQFQLKTLPLLKCLTFLTTSILVGFIVGGIVGRLSICEFDCRLFSYIQLDNSAILADMTDVTPVL
ncbi:unnamed protein product [Rhizophagus irregularis]|nr:unnamed protein product [Rhizophagus irregularis]